MVLMDPKFGIIIAITSILTLAVYSSSTNFVSAAKECFGNTSQGYVICSHTGTYSNGEAYSFLVECAKDKDDNWDCNALNKTAPPPGIDQAIANTVNELAPTNPNDSKDLGGMKTDKGITKSPIE